MLLKYISWNHLWGRIGCPGGGGGAEKGAVFRNGCVPVAFEEAHTWQLLASLESTGAIWSGSQSPAVQICVWLANL